MNKLMLLIAILFLFLYGGINYYIGLRMWENLINYIHFFNTDIYWILFSIIVLAYIISMLLPSYVPAIVVNTLNIVGSYWMGIMFYLILILPIIDLIKILNRKIVFIPKNLSDTANVSAIVNSLVITFIFGVMVYGTWSARSTKVTKYDLNINKIAGNIQILKIIMVSDIHLGAIVNNNRLTDMVNKINDLSPDLVLISGDIIDGKLGPFIKENMSDNFKRIKSKYGVYACLGNHDGMINKVEDVVKNFECAGINVLRDKAILIDNSFYVIGMDDLSIKQDIKVKRKDLAYLTKNLDKSKPLLLMEHQPKNLGNSEQHGIDLQISGHTHRGQLFPASIITKMIFEVDYGYLKKNNSNFIVSSGYGTWGPPVRLGSRCEIVEINLKFKE